MTENKSTFFARLYPHLTPRERKQVQVAYMITKFGHRHQTRKELDSKGDPLRYFEHPRRVSIIMMDEMRCYEPSVIIAGLLHDCLEDAEDIDDELIEHIFGEDVVRIVKCLSKDPKEGYVERLMLCSDWRVLALKGADRLDNLRSLRHGNKQFQEKQIEESIVKYLPVFQRMVDLAPDHIRSRVQDLKDLIMREIYIIKGSLSQCTTSTLS